MPIKAITRASTDTLVDVYWANYTCKRGSKASVDQHSDYLHKQHVISFQVRYKYTMQRQHSRQRDRRNKVKDNIQNTC
jgi:hypothetical protein